MDFYEAVGRDLLVRIQRDGESNQQYKLSLRAALDEYLKRKVPEECPHEEGEKSQGPSAPSGEADKTKHAVKSSSSASTSKPHLLSYKKTGGAADGAGMNYEWKMLTLVFLRLLAAGYEFQLASNMEEAGLFDDIVVRYRENSSDPWRVACLQLKHKQIKSDRTRSNNIPKGEFQSLTGVFGLVKYCVSFARFKTSTAVQEQPFFDEHLKVIIFTPATIFDKYVDVLETDKIFTTGGKVVSFKAGGEVYQELCEWVDFKEALTELHGQFIDDLSDEEVGTRIKEVLEKSKYQNSAVVSYTNQLLKCPTSVKLNDTLKSLEPIGTREMYESFLTNLQMYTNQAVESELDDKIKEEHAKLWIRSDSPEAEVMFNKLQEGVKLWWQKENTYLTQDSILWFGMIKCHTEMISKSTSVRLTQSGAEFVEESLIFLRGKIQEAASSGGTFNLRVNASSAASSLKVYQALAGLREKGNALHVDVEAFIEREKDVLSIWATRWCQVLVLECNVEIEQRDATRISERVLEVIERKIGNKLLVLVAPEKHELNVQLCHAKSYKYVNDNNFEWKELTEKTKENFLSLKVVLNGSQSPLSLADMLVGDEEFTNKAKLDVISQLMCGDVSCGKNLEEEGEIFVTRQLQESNDGVPFVVNSVSDVQKKVVLVVAEPGMGKSTLITHLAKSAKTEDPSAWIVHIKLNDCVQHLAEIDVAHFNEVTAKTFLEKSALSPGNCLEKLLFGPLENKLVVFIDGVDEVCPHYQQQVFKLIGFLKRMKIIQLWIASRPVFQTKLENELKMKDTLHLVAFTTQDQIMFFDKVWMTNDPLATPEKCSEMTSKLMTWLTDSLGEINPILGVPLMTAMVAEIFRARMLSTYDVHGESKNFDLPDVMKLFKTFVENKFEIYCAEKKKTSRRELTATKHDEAILLKQMLHNHCLAALRALFSPEEIAGLQFEGKERFGEDLAAYLEEVCDGREKLGIIYNVTNGIPNFVHRSLAEYFAATWLSRNYNENKGFMEMIIFNPAYKLLSEIFNRILTDNHPLHVAVLNRDLETVKKILNSQPKSSDINRLLDAGGRTPLHLAVLLSGTDRHPDFIRIVECLIQETKSRLDVADNIFGWGPLRYAEWSREWAALHIMLKNRREVEKIQDSSSIPDPPDSFSMLDAARYASMSVVRYLAEERGGNLDCRGPKGETMVHRAVEGGDVEMIGYLSKKGLSLDIKDSAGNTALHYASPQAVRFLVDDIDAVDLMAVNEQGLTALQFAAQNGAYDVMAALLEVKASFQVNPSAKATVAQLNSSLLCAVFAGSLECAKKFVTLGASIDHHDNNGHTTAWVAMHRKHIEVMNWLLLSGSNDGDTPLHGACRRGENEVVCFILSRGADIEAKGLRGQTPLIAAVQGGHLDVVKLLLEKGADVTGCDEDSWTPLQAATLDNKLEVVELLLEQGANVNCLDVNGDTPLLRASSLGHEQVAALLITRGADIHARSKMGWSSLHYAVRKKNPGMTKLLLEKKIDVDCSDNDGHTSLHIASMKGKEQLIDLLLLHGADIEAKSNESWTPLHKAGSYGQKQAATLLLSHGADINALTNCDRTPLACASAWGHEDVAALLLSHGADSEAKDKIGAKPLHAAAVKNRLKVVKLLLAEGVGMEWRDEYGHSPLILASAEGHEDVADALLSHGADISAANNSGETSLHLASAFGREKVIALLLRCGADIHAGDHKGWTPLHHASFKGHEQVVASSRR